jgi:hypothetical protein
VNVAVLHRPPVAADRCCAIVEAAYSIAGVIEAPIEPASLYRVIEAETGTLDETLYADALSRRGWVSLAEAIAAVREALSEPLGEQATFEHQGGSHWRAIVPGIADDEELAALLAAARDALSLWAPKERFVLVGALGGNGEVASARASARFNTLLDAEAGEDRIAVVRRPYGSELRRAS